MTFQPSTGAMMELATAYLEDAMCMEIPTIYRETKPKKPRKWHPHGRRLYRFPIGPTQRHPLYRRLYRFPIGPKKRRFNDRTRYHRPIGPTSTNRPLSPVDVEGRSKHEAAVIVAKAIARAHRLTLDDLTRPGRDYRRAHVRFAISYVLRQTIRVSLPFIGRLLGRDHTSIRNAIARFEGMINAGIVKDPTPQLFPDGYAPPPKRRKR